MANFDPMISILERDGAIKTLIDTRQERISIISTAARFRPRRST